MSALTVACVFVKGNVAYTPEYVARLRSMVARNLSKRHRFICLSDQDVPGVECIRIPTPPASVPGWWSKLELFNGKHGLKGKLLYLDLDVLIVRPIDPLVARMQPFSAVPHAGTFQGRDGKRVVPRLNSSVMSIRDVETLQWLWDSFDPALDTKRLWGDQDYLGEKLHKINLFPLPWFPRLSEVRPPWPLEARVVLCKKPKNHEAAATMPWFEKMWR